METSVRSIQQRSTAILQGQTLFDSIIADFPMTKESLWADAGIVYLLDFELALMKIQESMESSMTLARISLVSPVESEGTMTWRRQQGFIICTHGFEEEKAEDWTYKKVHVCKDMYFDLEHVRSLFLKGWLHTRWQENDLVANKYWGIAVPSHEPLVVRLVWFAGSNS